MLINNGAVAPERRLHYCPGDSPCSRRIFSLDGPIMLFLLCQFVYCEVIASKLMRAKGINQDFEISIFLPTFSAEVPYSLRI